MAAFKDGDASAIAALYTRDGQVLPPNSDFVSGTQAIQALWQAHFDRGIHEAKLESLEIEPCGDTAVEVSEFTLHAATGRVLEEENHVVIWKRETGQ